MSQNDTIEQAAVPSLRGQLLAVLTLAYAGGAIYLIPYIRYAFYDLQLDSMGITNTQIGLLTTAYGVGCILLYIPGGLLSDRTQVNYNIKLSLLAVTGLTVLYAFTLDNYGLALVIWFLFALSTAFVFWGSLLKALRLIGSSQNQGLLFGLYYMGNGLSGGAINTVGVWVSRNFESTQGKFSAIVLVYAASTFVAFFLVHIFLPADLGKKWRSNDNAFVRSQLGGLLKRPGVWLFAAITLTSYAAYSGAYYFTPYLTETGAATTDQAGLVASLRYATFALAPLSGFIADRVFKSTSKWFVLLFALLGFSYLGVLALPADTSGAYVTLYSFLPSLLGIAIYGIQFSVASEARIPAAVTATAIGIISMIGYTPDFFMAPLFGQWLDQYGFEGYTVIFVFLASVCLAGVVVSLALVRYGNTRSDGDGHEFPKAVKEVPAQ